MAAGTARPSWLSKKIDFRSMSGTQEKLSGLGIHTVCVQARCPNISECFGRGTATFLILGDTCTRGCSFCNVKKGVPDAPDREEPGRVAEAVKKLGLKYAVITSVTRDDLEDGGASAFAETARAIKLATAAKVEVLVPDFAGDTRAVDKVLEAGPDVFGHNIETVPSLYYIRKGASYSRSLSVLKHAAGAGAVTKSAIMLGLGEREDEVMASLSDLRQAGCSYLCIGQYLRPDAAHYPVSEFVNPG
ncbi:MAG TPA: lipoyl synthase, partial [Candidatus Goldiibacteriota bacterium]|nr:lipoyl synthase [Candidatus Goldiibacteriota bacterium]